MYVILVRGAPAHHCGAKKESATIRPNQKPVTNYIVMALLVPHQKVQLFTLATRVLMVPQ